MPIDKKGFKSIITSTNKQSAVFKELDNLASKYKNVLVIGRVTDIILNEKHTLFKNVGGYNGIGTILFQLEGDMSSIENIAKPLNPNSSYFPLINELVILFCVSNTNIGKIKNAKSYYYSSIINLWNNPHHNAYPNPLDLKEKEIIENTANDYVESNGQLVRRVTDGSTDIRLNTINNKSQVTFKEKSNIYPLKFFSGDLLNQGRFGNSIRLGSTNQYINNNNKVTGSNDWSQNKQNNTTTGDPIIILRNGQPTDTTQLPSNSWEPITENINNDQSSIYLTSTQKIPIDASSTTYSSYDSEIEPAPTIPSSYTGNQVIISSGRLLFNSNLDHILLSSKKTISFGAQKGFNFDTKSNFIVSVGTNIKLGGKEATESLILGDKFLENLKILLSDISALCIEISKIQDWKTAGPYPVVPTPANNGELARIANKVKTQIEGNGTGFIDRIDTYKSNVSKTL